MFLTTTFGRGGAERVLSILLEHLNRRRFTPELALFDLPVAYGVPKDVPISVLSQRPVPRSRPVIPVLAELEQQDPEFVEYLNFMVWKLVNLVRERRPDVVVASPLGAWIVALVAADFFPPSTRLVIRLANLPSFIIEAYPGRDASAELLRRLTNRSDEIVSVSHGAAQNLHEHFGADVSRVRVVYNPVNLAMIEPLSREPVDHPAFAHGRPVVVCVSRFDRAKGISYLIRAVAKLGVETPVQLVLVGDGAQRGYLQALAKHLGVEECVHFLGRQDNPFKFLAKATVFALPSLVEGMSNALIEAMACHCPVVATDIEGGVTQDVLGDGAYGLIVPQKDDVALADAIGRLLSDPALRERMARAGYRRARAFDLKKIVREYEGAILDAASRGADLSNREYAVAEPETAPGAGQAPAARESDVTPSTSRPMAGLLERLAGAPAIGPAMHADDALESSQATRSMPLRAVRERARRPGPTRLLVLVSTMRERSMADVTRVLAKYLSRRAYEVHVVTMFSEQAPVDPLVGADFNCLETYPVGATEGVTSPVPSEAWGDANDSAWVATMAARFLSAISQLEADAVLVEGFEAARLALIAKRWLGVDAPVFVDMHSRPVHIIAGPYGEFDLGFFRDHLAYADAVLVPSEEAAEELATTFGATSGATMIVPRPIDVEAMRSRLAATRAEHSWQSADVPLFMYVEDSEGPSDLELLFHGAKIAAQSERFRVLVVASGSDTGDLQRRARSAGVSDELVSFLPGPGWDDALMHRVTALVHGAGTIDAGTSDSIVRAMAAGCPVVSTFRSSAVSDLLGRGRSGLLVKVGDSQGLAEALLQLLWDDAERRDLSAGGPARLDRFSAETVSASLDSAISEFVGPSVPDSASGPASRGTDT